MQERTEPFARQSSKAYGPSIVKTAAKDFRLNGTDTLSASKIDLVIQWAESTKRDRHVVRGDLATTVPDSTRGARIYIGRKGRNDINSVLSAAKAACQRAPNAVSRGGRNRGVYVSRGRVSRTKAGIRNRAKKQFALVLELRQLGKNMFADDEAMVDWFMDLVDRRVPAAQFVSRNAMSESDAHGRRCRYW